MYGFKSFANRTEFSFSPGITAFVGPNGCGKSNVVDAIRWVLGEQNPRILRAVKLEDLIYAGTEHSQHKNYAEVSIVLDNSDNEIPLDFQEVTITRRYYRSGESEYFLNKVPCRLKDISEVLASTSLGRGTYAIIGQGQVEEVINSRPEERRAMFEEASGIALYKLRKRDAQKKLADTRGNLTRIEDIVHELESQEEEIRESAARAQEYLRYKEQADSLELALWAGKYQELQSRLERLDLRRQELENSRSQFQTRLHAGEAALAEKLASLEECQAVIGVLEENQAQLTGNQRELEYKLRLSQERQADYSQMVTDAEQQVARFRAQLEESHSALATLRDTISGIDQQIGAYGEALEGRNAVGGLVRRLLASAEQYREQAAAKLEEANVLESEIAAHRDRARQTQAELAGQLDSVKKEVETWQAQAGQAQADINLLQAAHTEKEAEDRALAEKLAELALAQRESEQSRDALVLKRTQLMGSQSVLRQKQEMLTAMAQDFQGFPPGTRSLLKASREGRVKGVLGAVADLIQVKDHRYSLAVETALGAALNYVVCSDEERCRQAIEFLKETGGGRATLVPVTAAANRNPSRPRDFSVPILGWADELVTSAPAAAPVAAMLLGNVLVTENLARATELAVAINYRYKIVTLEGEVISRGLFTGGSAGKNSQGLLQRKATLAQVEAQIEEQRAELNRVQEALTRQEAEAQALTREHDRLKGEREEIQRELMRIQAQIEQAQDRAEQATRMIAACSERQADLETKIDQARQVAEGVSSRLDADRASLAAVQAHKERIESLDTRLRDMVSIWASRQNSLQLTVYSLQNLAEDRRRQLKILLGQDNQVRQNLAAAEAEAKRKQEELEELTGKMAQFRAALSELSQGLETVAASLQGQLDAQERIKGEVEAASKDMAEIREELDNINSSLHDAELKIARWQTEAEAMVRELGSQFGLEPEKGLTYLDQRYSLSELAGKAKRMRARLEELGEVNLAAIGQHKKLVERLAFLRAQKQDLAQAERDILSLAAELDATIRSLFMETFAQVQQHFSEIFKVLFTGGNAYLSLTDQEDPLETGIEIYARPPGKKTQSLTLLSGGEKSMTAIALLFALQSVRPSPFSILDEVEAALDDVNILRFTQYLRRLAGKMQFILITHRRETMESSDSLYGITLAQDGSSQPISVALKNHRQEEQAI
jgi:chromosome segregation protein